MDLEENYDPDCDVSRFLAFSDPLLEGLVLSPCAEQQSLHMLDANARQSLSLATSEINSVSPVPSMTLPLSVEGVIILAMEGVNAEPTCEPIFEKYLPGQKDCTGCVTLREVTHCSASRNLTFTVHGGLGTFDHAVFDVEYFREGGQLFKRELFYVNLSTRSHEWVNTFMVGCVTRLQTDLTGTTKDSLCSFYDTLCADMNTPIEENMDFDFGPTFYFEDSDDYSIQLLPNYEVGESSRTNDDLLNDNGFKIDLLIGNGNEPTIVIPNPTAQRPSGSTSASTATPTGASTNFMEVSGSSSEGPTIVEYVPLHDSTVEPSDVVRRAPIRTPLALQRQRTANMRLVELVNYLHLPMAEAARQLGVCSTALKHVCRRNGLARWPSRQIQAIDRQIAKLERDMARGSRRHGLFGIREAIQSLQVKKTAIYEKMLNDS